MWTEVNQVLLQVSSALERAAEALKSGALCEGFPDLLEDLESDPMSALQTLEVCTHTTNSCLFDIPQ